MTAIDTRSVGVSGEVITMRITQLRRLKQAIIITSGALALLVAMSVPGQAGEVVITCTGSMRGAISEGEYSCVGGVQIADQQIKITGNSLQYTRKNNTISVQGDVQFTQGSTLLRGNELTYNLDDSTGNMQVVTMSDTPEGAISPVYVQSDSVSTCPRRLVLDGARLTTCDPVAPGYYLAAKKIEVYAEDRIVLYGVRFIESGITLYYWPKLVFSLKKGAKETGPLAGVELPRIGQSATEGWFIKTTYGYQGPGKQQGKILLDYMSLLGWGVGVNHTLRSDAQTQEAMSVYLQPNKSTGHLDVQASLTEQRELFGSIKLNATSSFSSTYTKVSGEQRRLYGNISLNRNVKSGSTAFNWTGTQLAGAVNGFDVSSTLHHFSTFLDGWQLKLDSSVQRRQRTDITDRNLVSYAAGLSRQTTDYSFSLDVDDRFNPDLTKETPPDVNWNRVSRLPEFKIQLNRLAIGGHELPFTVTAGYGNFAEYRISGNNTQRINTNRYQVGLGVKTLRLDLGRLGQFSWNGKLTRSVYSSNEMNWYASAESTYRLPISKNITLSGDYRYYDLFGDSSPLYFDKVAVGEQIHGRIDLQSTYVGGSVSTGYDIYRRVPLNVVVNGNVSSGSVLKLQGQAAYSQVSGVWLYGIATAGLKLNRFSMNLGTKVKLEPMKLERLDMSLQWDLEGWKVGYTGIYNALNDRFDRGDIAITRDLGCRSIDLRYSQPRKEIWLEYHITAFPQANVKLGASEKRLLFDLKSWEELITGSGS